MYLNKVEILFVGNIDEVMKCIVMNPNIRMQPRLLDHKVRSGHDEIIRHILESQNDSITIRTLYYELEDIKTALKKKREDLIKELDNVEIKLLKL